MIPVDSPEHDAALALIDAFDAETKRMKLSFWRRLWLDLGGRLCWRCRSQEADLLAEYDLCWRCQVAFKKLRDVQ